VQWPQEDMLEMRVTGRVRGLQALQGWSARLYSHNHPHKGKTMRTSETITLLYLLCIRVIVGWGPSSSFRVGQHCPSTINLTSESTLLYPVATDGHITKAERALTAPHDKASTSGHVAISGFVDRHSGMRAQHQGYRPLQQ
jgi:hypothetical protein